MRNYMSIWWVWKKIVNVKRLYLEARLSPPICLPPASKSCFIKSGELLQACLGNIVPIMNSAKTFSYNRTKFSDFTFASKWNYIYCFFESCFYFQRMILLPLSSGTPWGSQEMISITSDQRFYQEEKKTLCLLHKIWQSCPISKGPQ